MLWKLKIFIFTKAIQFFQYICKSDIWNSNGFVWVRSIQKTHKMMKKCILKNCIKKFFLIFPLPRILNKNSWKIRKFLESFYEIYVDTLENSATLNRNCVRAAANFIARTPRLHHTMLASLQGERVTCASYFSVWVIAVLFICVSLPAMISRRDRAIRS